jgi:hypothetical protein
MRKQNTKPLCQPENSTQKSSLENQAAFSIGSGGRIRTIDLRVMSPTSCHCSTPRQQEYYTMF